jgi:L,D-transpeptidase YcbB
VQSGKTVTFDLPRAMPIYLAYFTAAPAADGSIAFRPDIYRRDSQVGVAATEDRVCRG